MPHELSPTLLIGLGGTGKDVLLRIRRSFFERYGKDPSSGYVGFPIVGYLMLDTDGQKLDEVANETLPKFVKENIKFDLSGNEPDVVVCKILPNEFNDYFQGGKATFPHIFRWMPQAMSQKTAVALSHGAGQNRLFGRLAFFRHFPAIRLLIEKKLMRLVEWAANPTYRQKWLRDGMSVNTSQINVIIVYSLAGGTGAGMFLDVGMLVRDIITRSCPNQMPFITHYTVLPDVLTSGNAPLASQNEHRDKVRKNAFAALLEMEYFAQRKIGVFDLSIPPRPTGVEPGSGPEPIYLVEWERGRPIPVNEPPWNQCYLIGASNDPLVGSPQPYNDIYQMIADHIFLDFDPSDFGKQQRANRSNDEEQLQRNYKQDVFDEDSNSLFPRFYSRRFSTFGLAQLRFDRDRMRRAAAHRLAWQLVGWWARDNQLRPAVIDQYAREDLGAPAERSTAASKMNVTVVPGDPAGQRVVRLGTDAIYQRLVQKGGDADQTWGNLLQGEQQQILKAIEDGEIGDVNSEPYSAWIERHRAKLIAPEVGDREQADAGIVLKTAAANRDLLIADVRERIERLFRYRMARLGFRDTGKLFDRYAAILQEQQQFAEADQNRGAKSSLEWKQRLREAGSLPAGFARTATHLELLRAADGVLSDIGGLYRRALAPDIRKVLDSAQRRVAPGPQQDGSYTASLTRFLDGARNVREYLQSRFEELSAKDVGQRTTKGGEDLAKRFGRVTALMDKQSEAEYDQKIAAALDIPNIAAIEWSKLEAQILAELAQSGDRRLSGVSSLADLVLRFSPLALADAAPVDAFKSLARELADACEAALKDRFATDTTALHEYHKQPDTEKLLENLRTFSAPYLRRNPSPNADSTDVATRQLLGLADFDSSDAGRFVADLRRSGDKDKLTLAGMQSLTMNDDAITLYREKIGIPLCYCAELEDLGRVYDDMAQERAEAHIDFNFLHNRLPEIRMIERAKQPILVASVELTFFGLMTGRMTCEVDHADPKKQTFKFQPRGGAAYPLGGQVEEVVRKLTENEKRRGELLEEVASWLIDKGGLDKGRLLAILWAALRWFQDELQRRVQALIDREPDRYGREEHPLIKVVRDRMLTKIRHRIEAIPGAAQHIAPLLEWERIYNDRDRTSSARDDARSRARQYVAGTFKPINDDDLPIPVLLQPTPGFNVAVAESVGA